MPLPGCHCCGQQCAPVRIGVTGCTLPVDGASVTLKNSSGSTVFTGTTDSSGSVMATIPSSGTYTLIVTATGFVSSTTTVNLVCGGTSGVILSLDFSQFPTLDISDTYFGSSSVTFDGVSTWNGSTTFAYPGCNFNPGPCCGGAAGPCDPVTITVTYAVLINPATCEIAVHVTIGVTDGTSCPGGGTPAGTVGGGGPLTAIPPMLVGGPFTPAFGGSIPFTCIINSFVGAPAEWLITITQP
jgi:Carboxypeptidase regulatory-like domain